jgi:arsenate reductase
VTRGVQKRVLFVCIGNACRSQMAEAFARHYGSDILIPASAGLAPAFGVASATIRAMDEKHLNLRDHFPKAIRYLERAQFDLVVNMSGHSLPDDVGGRVISWDVPDPVALDYAEHCAIRDDIERRVIDLITELRREPDQPRLRGQGSGPVRL